MFTNRAAATAAMKKTIATKAAAGFFVESKAYGKAFRKNFGTPQETWVCYHQLHMVGAENGQRVDLVLDFEYPAPTR